MPYFRRRRTTRRPLRRRRLVLRKPRIKKNVSSHTTIRGSAPISDRLHLKLRYSDDVDIQGISGLVGDHIFLGNGLFKPDFTSTGHQPLGFDQWVAFFDKYVVLASSIKVQAVSEDAVAASSLSVVPKITSGAPIADTLHEKPYVRTRIVTPNSQDPAVLKHYMSTKKMLGLRGVRAEDNTYVATTGGDPAQKWHWHVLVNAFDGSASVNIRARVNITYYVIFFARKSLTQST